MTQNPITWTRVLFGAGLTLAVAMSPILYVVLFASSPDGVTRRADGGDAAMGLVSNGFNPADHRDAILLIAGIAFAGILAIIAVAARSLNSESAQSHS